MEKTTDDFSWSDLDDSKNDKPAPKGLVTISKTFREGLIYIYQRADYRKPTWLCRVKVPGHSGYVTRSTGTGDEHKAFKFADDLYNQLLVKSLTGSVTVAKKIGPALDRYIQRLEINNERLSIRYKILLMQRIRPLLAPKTFDDISTALLLDLTDALVAKSTKKQLSPNTIKRIQSDLKHFLQWCIEQGYVDALPRFPKISSVRSSRPHFDAKDWTKLVRHLREFIKIKNRAVRRDRMMLRDYVLILANTGIRVGEARLLKWRDVTERGGSGDVPANVVLTVDGKTGIREVVARSSDVKKYFKRILDLRIEELTTTDNPKPTIDANGLIFCHKDGTEIGTFKKSFAALIKSANVEQDSHGNPRTLYPLGYLRWFAIGCVSRAMCR